MNIHTFVLNFFSAIDKFWHYVIISISNKEIKVANVVLAFGVIYFGAKNYKKLVAVLSRQIFSEKCTEYKELTEKLISISLGMILVILILQIANVPLDTFAFLGGALALGVGLGVQNLINNLLSSFIIVVEKPLSVGDLVTVDSCTGIVEEIGNRCIVIRNSSNAAVFVPSSTVLQSKLINWTHKNSISHETKIKIPKKYLQEHNIDQTIEIIEKALNGQVISAKALLLSSAVSWYVYSLNYTTLINSDVGLIQHQLSKYLLENLGPEIIIENIDKR
jgi:hypothetical protein